MKRDVDLAGELSPDGAHRDAGNEIEDVLLSWRIRALNTVLGVLAIVAFAATLFPLITAIRDPNRRFGALIFVAVYLLFVGLALFRGLDFRLRGWIAFLLGYAVSVVAFARSGLVGSGRAYILILPILATILLGVRSGLIATALSLAILTTFTVLAHLGVLENWLIYRDNPLALGPWAEAWTDVAMFLVLTVVLLERFHRLQMETMEAEHQASAELAQVNAELESRVEQRTSELARANAQLTEEVAERKEVEEALRHYHATQAAVALENARLYAETRERARRLGLLHKIYQETHSTLDLTEILTATCQKLVEHFPAEHSGVLLFDDAYTYGEVAAEFPPQGAVGIRIPLQGYEATAQIIGSGESLAVYDAQHDPVMEAVWDVMRSLGIRSLLIMPLVVKGRVIGTFSLDVLTAQRHFTPAEIELTQTVAAQLSMAVANAQLFEEVQRQKQYSEALIQNSPTAIVVGDTNHRVVSWNPAAERLFGYSEEEAIGRHIDELVAAGSLREEAAAYTQQTQEGNLVRAITRRTHRDGTLLDVQMLGVPLSLEGERVGHITIYHDITELQRARQEAEAASRAKSAFLATMSHEIRTPMNGVIGMTSLLMDTDLTAEQREFVETIRTSGDALLTIINDVLDFSKIEAGRMDLERQPVNLRECVGEAVELLANKAVEKDLELTYLVDGDAPAAIWGDATRLRQVLVNLLSNAIKFTEEGEVVVRVESEQVGRSVELHFSVRDTGIGIPPEKMERLFRSFSQVDASTTRRYGGTGLGLAISRRLVELMGGEMWVESEVGVGSIFHFTLRVDSAPLPRPIYLHEEQPNLEGRRVLIVDDNAANRRILTLQTRSWGMLPQETSIPEEALAWIRAGQPFDVILLDYQMPEMDGVRLAAEIRRSDASSSEVPLVMLSSLGRPEAGDVEFAAHLTKPVKSSRLYEVLIALFTEMGEAEAARRGGGSVFDAGMAERLPLRILLVEDNLVNQNLTLHLLERLGYDDVDLAVNGVEALEALRRQVYDVVLMDVQMPEMDGLEATRRIRLSANREERPRIIALTASAMQEDREACYEAGMDDYLSKPVRVPELVEALKRSHPNCADATPAPAAASAVEIGSAAPASLTLDPTALQKLESSLGSEKIVRLLGVFHESADRLLGEMRRSFAAGEIEALQRAAHTLKSTSATIGAQILAEIARAVEFQARDGVLDGVSERITAAETEYRAVKEALAQSRGGGTHFSSVDQTETA